MNGYRSGISLRLLLVKTPDLRTGEVLVLPDRVRYLQLGPQVTPTAALPDTPGETRNYITNPGKEDHIEAAKI